MVGFSLGGHLAFFAATQVPLAAVAVVYPGWLDTTGTALGTPGPLLDLVPDMAGRCGRLLYLTGADDHVVSADQTRSTAAALTAAGVRHETVVYPDTPHGFLADERDTYRPEVAADAWRRIDALLDEELPGAGSRQKLEPDGSPSDVPGTDAPEQGAPETGAPACGSG